MPNLVSGIIVDIVYSRFDIRIVQITNECSLDLSRNHRQKCLSKKYSNDKIYKNRRVSNEFYLNKYNKIILRSKRNPKWMD